MTQSEILQKHEDANEMHLHHVDRKWVFEAMEEYSNICNQRLKTLAKLLAKTWFYGEWEWENPNERIQQMIMQDLGYYPFKDEDEMIHKTRVDEELYREAVDKVPLGNPRTPTPVECHNSSDISDKPAITMTAEEFFRNKIKEKNPLIEIITLSSILVTAEEAMRWSYEFNQLVKSEIQIISDEQIDSYVKSTGYYGHCTPEYHEGIEEGAKWYREQLKSKQ